MSTPHRSNTLDRLQRFSFGGSRSSSKDRDRKKDASDCESTSGSRRSSGIRGNSDKTERLRELTEKLKGLSPQVRSPVPKRPNRRLPPSSKPKPTLEDPVQIEPVPTPSTYRKFPFKSVSFSQVDFSPIDGKYTRRKSISTITPIPGSEFIPPSTASPISTVDSRSLTHPLGKRGLRATNRHTLTKKLPHPPIDDIVNPNQPQLLPSAIPETDTDCDPRLTPDPVNCDTQTDLPPTQPRSFPNTLNSDPSGTEPRVRHPSSSVDKSRKRKGVYITKWPSTIETTEEILGDGVENIPTIFLQDGPSDSTSAPSTCWSSPQEEPYTPEDWYGDPFSGPEWPPVPDSSRILRNNLLVRGDSLSESESEHRDYLASSRPSIYSDKSDLSDCEGPTGCSQSPRRYSKRPLRGPYGQMLEAEMKKPDTNKMFSKLYYNKELKFLDDLMGNITNTSEQAIRVAPTQDLAIPTPLPTPNVVRTRSSGNRSLDETQLKHKDEVAVPTKPAAQRKTGANAVTIPFVNIVGGSNSCCGTPSNTTPLSPFIRHQRTTSSPSKLEGIGVVSKDLTSSAATNTLDNTLRPLDSNAKASAECLNIRLSTDSVTNTNDTRTHVVVELYDTERTYVESLQTLVLKYLQPLKSSENLGLLDPAAVDEIFDQVPALLSHHEIFLEELQKRLEHWDMKQKIGDVFIDVFTKPEVVETYTAFINNWKKAKELIKVTAQAKPAFARFLEAMAREHKGKFALDSLLIKPIQKFPKYEMLIQRLLKHTDISHPDHQLLIEAQFQIHELLLKINCTERETNEYEQQQQNLKELECLVEGLMNLVVSDRQYLRHDLVTMATAQGNRKDRALFLFSDLLVITSIKRRSGTVRKPSTLCPVGVTNSLETHKYKLLMRLPMDDIEIIKPRDDSARKIMSELEHIAEDVGTLNRITELVLYLHCPHEQLEEIVREMLAVNNRQLSERQNSGSQVSYLELSLSTSNGIEVISILFQKNEQRSSWEEAFNEAKQRLALSPNRRALPEFISAVPIRKTRSGLQFTCAAPALVTTALSGGGIPGTAGSHPNHRAPCCQDVWVCNSDGYVGQVCVLSLYPEPTVVSCNSVCNARILCMASIPAIGVDAAHSPHSHNTAKHFSYASKATFGGSGRDGREGAISGNIHLDSSSSSESENEEVDAEEPVVVHDVTTPGALIPDLAETAQPTMWLGTEDGCIHMYNSSDNIRIKKNKIKIQHSSAVQCIICLDNRVFVSLANGDLIIYTRDALGVWNTTEPCVIPIGTAAMPVLRMLPNNGKLWCGCPTLIKIFNITKLQVEHTLHLSNDNLKQLSCMTLSGLGVWLSMHNSAVVKCFHTTTYELLCEVNVTPTVNKMLSSCDDIIRQHKAACLRVTALLACKDLLWVGTSAGVLLTVLIPHVTPTTERIVVQLSVTGLSHGHTGQVRFLTFVEDTSNSGKPSQKSTHHKYSTQTNKDQTKIIIISGGDGYEDFRNASVSEMAGREDSTNHLLLWRV